MRRSSPATRAPRRLTFHGHSVAPGAGTTTDDEQQAFAREVRRDVPRSSRRAAHVEAEGEHVPLTQRPLLDTAHLVLWHLTQRSRRTRCEPYVGRRAPPRARLVLRLREGPTSPQRQRCAAATSGRRCCGARRRVGADRVRRRPRRARTRWTATARTRRARRSRARQRGSGDVARSPSSRPQWRATAKKKRKQPKRAPSSRRLAAAAATLPWTGDVCRSHRRHRPRCAYQSTNGRTCVARTAPDEPQRPAAMAGAGRRPILRRRRRGA